ncbi:uncharacterized protein LOC110024684 [Phalaenopsis equestris]|uniref:uncharacterized protein LOC110024684 n=1 Tax=Phalaenopsis equestris TaxID=78828 RepID=UPI0009E4ED7E|nr:uncharacterized protein LOC110024684 [Phalaenopsis equestris]
MKHLLLLLLISLGLAAIFTTSARVEVGGSKHNHPNFLKEELEVKNNKEKKIISPAGSTNPTSSKFVNDDLKKENKDINNGVGDKYLTVSIDDDAYPSANGASIDTHHMISIEQYKRIISDRPFHP